MIIGPGSGCRSDQREPPAGLGQSTCELFGESREEPVILFGDLHAHTSTSLDASLLSLPLLKARPYGPDDACAFARFCSQLDFWSINDHAEEMLAEHWQENLASVRDCNARFDGYHHDAEMVTFLGWEWTQSTNDPATDFGHHNVVLKDTCSEAIPARPFAAPASFAGIDPSIIPTLRDLVVALDPENAAAYDAVVERVQAFEQKPLCDGNVDTLDLPPDCHEVADTPADVYRLFERWGLDAIAVPHGTAWGTHHTQLVTWRQRFTPEQLSPIWSPLVEIHSGHGNSEEYRPYRHAEIRDDELQCPMPTAGFEPCCWRAGEIIRARSAECEDEPASPECEAEVDASRQAFLAGGKRGFRTVPRAEADDWLECGQCVDCFQPALGLRPERTAQAALAMTNLEDPDAPWRYVFGFVSSTDTHQTGPGAGYKEFLEMSDASGASSPEFEPIVETAVSQITPDHTRQESFNFAGGLVAVHARARNRDAIWQALLDRRVYATSGERIELWFDWIGSDATRAPMGSKVVTTETPTFEIRARGSYRQAPGCPDWVEESVGPEFIERMCFGECYHPLGERHRITAVEIVKVRPQVSAEEPLRDLIQDPFLVLPCAEDQEECSVTFQDDQYELEGRPASYYVRVLQAPTQIFNQGTLRCTRDEAGRCIDTNPCDTGPGSMDDCLALGQERAWSSPIYLYPDEAMVPVP